MGQSMSEETRGEPRLSDSRRKSGMLRALLRSDGGNVLAITAAATIPMLGVIGGAVDISRLYLTKSRIQAACDSAVLAGRKAMTTNTYTDAAKSRAESMFRANFEDEDYGTSLTNFTSSADAQGKVSGSVSTRLPMVLMQIFGTEAQDLSVTCSADIQVPNIDIVMVLDVTGSMNECADGHCSSGEQKKIDALKEAAKDFYSTLQTALAGNTTSQVRYGFVPYAEAVNGLDVFKASPNLNNGELPLSHFVDTMTVQSRVANFNTKVTEWIPDPNSSPVTYNQVFNTDSQDSKEPFKAYSGSGTQVSDYDCTQYGSNRSWQIGSGTEVYLYPKTSWPGGEGIGEPELYKADGSNLWQTSAPTNADGYTKITFERVSWSGGNSSLKACTRKVTHTHYIKQERYKFTNWTFRPVDYNVSGYKSGSSITYLSSINTNATVETQGSYDPVTMASMGVGTNSTASWNGCIEERTTVAASNFSPIPTNARDLNFVDGGTSSALQWRPVIRALTYDRRQTANRENVSNSDAGDYDEPTQNCPSARMRSLNVMTQTQFNNYINTLSPGGNTYLDVGMIWGLRLIAPQGMFAARNLTGPNGGQISRHIIFLTDGVPVSNDSNYTAYGVERMEKRVTGSTGVGQATLHARRFQAMCDAARGQFSIWAIAFGTSVTGNLSTCADPGRAYEADDTEQLKTAFKNIAKEVADLRLVE